MQIVAGDILLCLFFLYSEKKWLDISYEQTSHMKCEA